MSGWDVANIAIAVTSIIVLAALVRWNARKDREMVRDLRAELGLPPNDPTTQQRRKR